MDSVDVALSQNAVVIVACQKLHFQWDPGENMKIFCMGGALLFLVVNKLRHLQ